MLRKNPQDFAEKTQKTPRNIKKVLLLPLTGLAVLLSGYLVWSSLPKQVEFSYAGDTCVSRLVLLPGKQTSSADKFEVVYKNGVKGLFATKVCLQPTSAPDEGLASVTTAQLGIFRSSYKVHVAPAPRVTEANLEQPVALAKPVIFSIDKTDNIHSYQLENEQKSQTCNMIDTELKCNIDELGLEQGSENTVALTRSFRGSDKKKVTDETLTVLPAVNVADSSVKSGQVIYDKPHTFTFTTSETVTNVKAELSLVEGETSTPVSITTEKNDKTITVAVEDDLAREKSYRLTLQEVISDVGSTLNEPYVVNFTTSGGPKIIGINIGTSGVEVNSRVVVSFDQPLADSVNINDFAKINGASAAISKSGSQVFFALQNTPRCTAFTLSIAKGIQSGVNDLKSTVDWSYSSRINCRATSTIGYSVRGRPIVAYYYGSGSNTIMFTGGIHGTEPSGYQTMQGWVNHLDANAYKIPADKQVVIVPNTNPDGIAAGTRYNANNVNLARNFPTADWRSDIDAVGGTVINGGGTSPLSEPEARALANLTSSLRPRAQISFHAQGRLVGANDYADSRSIGSLYASTVGYGTMFGGSAEEIMGYTFTGEYDTWIGEKLGRPSLVVELPSASGNYLNSNLSALWKMVNL